MLRANSLWIPLLVAFLPLAVILILSAICRVPDYSGAENQLTTHGLVYIGPLARLMEFAVGIALQVSRRKRRDSSAFGPHIWLLQPLSLGMAAWFLAKGGTLGIRSWMPHLDLVRLLWRPSNLGFRYLDFFFFKRLAGGLTLESCARSAWRDQFCHLSCPFQRWARGCTGDMWTLSDRK
jgi:hypothetical protein